MRIDIKNGNYDCIVGVYELNSGKLFKVDEHYNSGDILHGERMHVDWYVKRGYLNKEDAYKIYDAFETNDLEAITFYTLKYS